MRQVWDRLKMVVGRLRVTLVNDVASVQYIQGILSRIETRDNTPRLAEFGFTSNPPLGSDAVLACIGGDRSNAVIVATGHQQSRPTGLASGESMLYSEDGKSVYMTAAGGIVVNANGQVVTVNNATMVTIVASVGVVMDTPMLAVTGDIIDNSGTNTHTLAEMRAIYNEHTHSTPAGESGGPNATQ